MNNPNTLYPFPQEQVNARELQMEEIANSLSITEADGTVRQPFYEAFDYLMELRDKGIPGGCAETSAIFAFGRERIESLGLLPDINSEFVLDENRRMIRLTEQLYKNMFEISAGEQIYRPINKISAKRPDLIEEVLYKPLRSTKFLATINGDFFDEETQELHKSGHMIAGIINGNNNLELPASLNRFNATSNIPYYFVWDSSDFGRRISANERQAIVTTPLPFPPGMRLMSPRLISKLLVGYSDGSPIHIKMF